MIPKDKWKEVLDNCEGVSNVTLVCEDGSFPTHKIVLARVSDFITDLLLPVPSSDDVTILLPDFKVDHVCSVIDQFNFGGSNQSLLDEDLLSALKCSPITFIKMEPEMSIDLDDENFDSNIHGNEDSKQLETICYEISEIDQQLERLLSGQHLNDESFEDGFDEEKISRNGKPSHDKLDFTGHSDNGASGCEIQLNDLASDNSDDPLSTTYKVRKQPLNDEGLDEKVPMISDHLKQQSSNCEKEGENSKRRKSRGWLRSQVSQAIATEKRQNLQNLAKKCLMNIDEKVSDIMDNTGVKKIKSKKKELYRNAVEAIARGEFNSLFAVSKKYGVNRRTLLQFLNSGNWIGSGSMSHIFSESEEKSISERIIQNSEKGKLSSSFIQNILLQEFELLKISHPERNLPSSLYRQFLQSFLSRNNLMEICQFKPYVRTKKIENQQTKELAKKFLINNDVDEDDNRKKGQKEKIYNERQKLRKAVEALAKGECKTVHKAARQYGVNKKTLGKHLQEGKNYQGPGKILQIFSYEEEKNLTERILAKSDGGKHLTFDIIKEVINEEKKSALAGKNFVYNFAKRNNLDQIINNKIEADREDRRNFECEICYQKFTFKNALVKHRERAHSAFYN